MNERNFRQLLEAQWTQGKFVCVGLDSDIAKIPWKHIPGSHNMSDGQKVFAFNRAIVDTTHGSVCAYKPNSAFYESLGECGLHVLKETIAYIHKVAPHVPVIYDAKRADIGNTNGHYVKAAFDYLGADAITAHPYLGFEAMQPFLDRADKGIIVLCRTSNKGAGEFQDLITLTMDPTKKPANMTAETWLQVLIENSLLLYQRVATNVARKWNRNGNCLLVLGATYPVEAEAVRGMVGNVPFLIPGIGTQGGDLKATVHATMDGRGLGMIINASSSVIFASSGPDFAQTARSEVMRLNVLIEQFRANEAHP